jgi:hypothetical protein
VSDSIVCAEAESGRERRRDLALKGIASDVTQLVANRLEALSLRWRILIDSSWRRCL